MRAGAWGRGHRAAVVAALSLALAVALPASAVAMTPAEEEFCAPRQLVDYAAPLAHLPKVREPPRSGRLPFGPRRLFFQARLDLAPHLRGIDDRVVVSGDAISYRLSLTGAAYGGVRLGWTVRSRLVRINRRGRALDVAKRRQQRVGFLDVDTHEAPFEPPLIGFSRSPRPGLYRYDIVFRDRNRDLLGRYHDYYRVVRRNPEIRLVLNASSFRVGEQVRAKVENPGTESFSYGAGFEIDRFDGAEWNRVPFQDLFGHPNIVILIAYLSQPGTSGDCFTGFVVPETMSPGLYRMVAGPNLTGEFTVVP